MVAFEVGAVEGILELTGTEVGAVKHIKDDAKEGKERKNH